MNWIEILKELLPYGISLVIAFVAWLRRKLEKPEAQVEAVKDFHKYARRAYDVSNKVQFDELLNAFIAENPQYEKAVTRIRKRNARKP